MPSDSITFDRAAGFYDETRGFPPGEEQHVAALFAQAGALTADQRVLEIGVGTGRIALPLAAHVRTVIGLDLSRPMLERLRAKRRGEPVHVLEGDATQLPFAPGAFDAVVAVHVFHLMADWRGALAEIVRVLRPGGMLLHGYHQRIEQPETLLDVMSRAWEGVIGAERTPVIGIPRELRDHFLDESGWQRVGATQLHLYRHRMTPREYLNWMERRVWSSLWHVSDEAVQRGLGAVQEVIAAHGIPLDQPVESVSNFAVQAYLPPPDPGRDR
jgi:SAM-dependent methyltransferase